MCRSLTNPLHNKVPTLQGQSNPTNSSTQLINQFTYAYCRKYEVLNLKVVHRRHSTGFEQARELPLHIDDLIAGRYQVGAEQHCLRVVVVETRGVWGARTSTT